MTDHSCRFFSLNYWYGAFHCLFLLLFFFRIANYKANALFHKQFCGGQDGNALYTAIVYMLQDQELCEEAVSKDQMLKVYPLCLFSSSFKVCWVITSIQIFCFIKLCIH